MLGDRVILIRETTLDFMLGFREEMRGWQAFAGAGDGGGKGKGKGLVAKGKGKGGIEYGVHSA